MQRAADKVSESPAPVVPLAEIGDAVDLGEGVGGGRTEEEGRGGGLKAEDILDRHFEEMVLDQICSIKAFGVVCIA